MKRPSHALTALAATGLMGGCANFTTSTSEWVTGMTPLHQPANNFTETFQDANFGTCLAAVQYAPVGEAAARGQFNRLELDQQARRAAANGNSELDSFRLPDEVSQAFQRSAQGAAATGFVASSTTVNCSQLNPFTTALRGQGQISPFVPAGGVNVNRFQQRTPDGLACTGQVVTYRDDAGTRPGDVKGPAAVPLLLQNGTYQLQSGVSLSRAPFRTSNGEVMVNSISCGNDTFTIKRGAKAPERGFTP